MNPESRILKTESRDSAALLTVIAAVGFLIHLLCLDQYGIFRDEFYYLACGEHLDWGYVDHPPFVALAAAFSRALPGESIHAIRLIPVLAGTAVVFMAGWTARELGGGRYAQALAALAAMLAPVNLFLYHILSMNVFDHLFWIVSAWLVIRWLKTDRPGYWIALGVVLGIGLQNKISMGFFAVALAAGLMATRRRAVLRTRYPWLAALIAFLIFLPHLLWQMRHDFPTLEFIRNAAEYKITPVSPPQFILGQALEAQPLGFALVLLGLVFFLFMRTGKPYRLLGWLYLALLILFVAQRAKTYYIAPVYPLMFAAGAVAVESWVRRRRFPVYVGSSLLALFVVTGAALAPLTLPVMNPERLVRDYGAIYAANVAGERNELGLLPQHFADMFGWEDMVAAVAQVYHSLPPEERAKCAIYVGNYGEAGAIDFLGRRYGLPKAISGHNSYFLWGCRDYTGEIIIELNDDDDYEELLEQYDSVERRGAVYHPFAMPYENNLTIFLCRGLRQPLSEIWPQTRLYI